MITSTALARRCWTIDTVPEDRFQRVVAIFDHPSLRLNHEP
jgi:hypothetical protein